MIDAVFDTNLIIDVEEKREGYENILLLLDLESRGYVRCIVPIIVESEKSVNGSRIKNLDDYVNYLKKLGFKNITTLAPIGYYGMCRFGYCIYGGPGTLSLAKQIHNILFEKIEFEYKDYCAKRGLDPAKGIDRKWQNALIDTLILWSAVYYKKGVLVTRDGNFHKHKCEIYEHWGIDVRFPKDLLNELFKDAKTGN